MKKGLSIFLVAIAALVVATSCGSAPSSERIDDPNMPEWLNDFAPEDVIWGIGSAKQSSDQLGMTSAENRARVSIALQLNAKIDAMFTDYMRDAGTVGSQTALSLQESISRQVTSMQLNGTQPDKRWKAPNGTWWYRVEYKVSDAKSALAPLFTSEEASYAEFKADEALRMLDSQLAKPEKAIPVYE